MRTSLSGFSNTYFTLKADESIASGAGREPASRLVHWKIDLPKKEFELVNFGSWDKHCYPDYTDADYYLFWPHEEM